MSSLEKYPLQLINIQGLWTLVIDRLKIPLSDDLKNAILEANEYVSNPNLVWVSRGENIFVPLGGVVIH